MVIERVHCDLPRCTLAKKLEAQITDRKKCSDGVRPLCCFSNVCKMAVFSVVWWGALGLGDCRSGSRFIHDVFGIDMVPAAALVALILAVVTTAMLLPCGILTTVMQRWGVCRREVSAIDDRSDEAT